MNELITKLNTLCQDKFEHNYEFTHSCKANWCELKNKEDLIGMVKILKTLKSRVCTITCYSLDDGSHEIVYHFDIEGSMVNLKVKTFDKQINSITPYFKSADWTERELSELYDIKIDNHPNPERLFLDEKIKKNVMNDYISLSSAMSGKITQVLWEKVKQNEERLNG